MTSTHLTPEQKQQFEEDGLLILAGLFNADEVAEMRQAANEILELILNSSAALGRKSGRLDWLPGRNGRPLVRKIQPINDLSPCLESVARDPRLLDPLRDIMNDEPVLMEEKLNYKQPLEWCPPVGLPLGERQDDRFPVHSDWAYYKAQNYPQDIVSSAVALDACTPDNGPLHVWPGSHREHLAHENIEGLGLQVLPGLIDFDGGCDVLCPPGSVMFFHSLLIHNSRPNATAAPRRLMIYSHYPARFRMEDDIRNGPGRRREQEFERRYREAVAAGEFVDVFHAAGG